MPLKASNIDKEFILENDYEIVHFDMGGELPYDSSPHHHDFFKLYFAFTDNIKYVVESKSYTLNKGDIILINPRELHRSIFEDKNFIKKGVLILLGKSYFKKLKKEEVTVSKCFDEDFNVLHPEEQRFDYISRLLESIYTLTNQDSVDNDGIKNSFIQLLMVLGKQCELESGEYVEGKTNVDIAEIVDYIIHNICSDLSLDVLAGKFYISKYHLLREFKKCTGTTIHRYITQKRLIVAKELLANGMNITVVYKKSGFGDYSNFFRSFKKEYNMTPRQYYEYITKTNDGDI